MREMGAGGHWSFKISKFQKWFMGKGEREEAEEGDSFSYDRYYGALVGRHPSI